MSTVTSQAELDLLSQAASEFGDGVVNLGRDPSMFGMESFTLSATFELNSLDGGRQRVLWNHTQYGIEVYGDDLRIALRASDGSLDYYKVPNIINNTGWHDVQVTYDASSGGLAIWLDGENIFSKDEIDVDLGEPRYWDVTAGGTAWGDQLDGQVADVSFHDEVLDIDGSQSTYDRMYSLDDGSLPEKISDQIEDDELDVEIPREQTETELLESAASEFGDGVVNLGRDPSMFGMESFTLSATFELNSLDGGRQRVLWNHTQYGIEVYGDDLRIALRASDGSLDYYKVPNIINNTGWHDVQVTYDASSGGLAIWLDGENIFSKDEIDVDLGEPRYWDVTAGGTAWGDQLDGQVADVSFHDEVLDIDGSQSTYDRMYSLDDGSLPSKPNEEDGPLENTEATISGVDTGAVEEDGVLTAKGKLTADDVDAGESGFVAGTVAGTYGSLSIDAAGNWAYTAADSAALQALGAGDTVVDKMTVTTPDGTTHTIAVTLEGSNDAPVISGVDTGSVAEDGPLQTVGKLTADDADAGESGFVAGIVQGKYGVLTIDAAGNWAYNASGNDALQALGEGDVVTEKLTVTTVDGTPQVITVSVSGTDDTVVISGVDTGTVEEDGVLTAKGKLTADDVDAGESGFVAGKVAGTYGSLSIDAAGNWAYTAADSAALQALGAGDTVVDKMTVTTPDGTTHTIAVTLEGSNDAPVISGVDTGTVEEDGVLTAKGKLTADDVDAGESGFVAGTVAGTYGSLSIDAAGNWAYTAADSAALQALGAGDTVVDKMTVTTPDGTTHTIAVTLEGSNDAPVISGVDTGSVAEDGPLQTVGKLTADDADAGESGFVAGIVQGKYGVLTIDAAGNWAYNASGNDALQALGEGDVVTEKLTVTTVDGTPQVITVSVSGTDDTVVISGVDTGTVEEDGVLTAKGKLTADDVDAGESGFVAGKVAGTYGSLSIDAAGNWAYTAADSAALQALGAGDTVVDKMTVTTPDGTTHTIAVTLEGSNDAPVISGVDTGTVEEDGVLTATGKLTADDVDASESGFVAGKVAGTYGSLSIDAAGNWAYTAADSAALQALGEGDTIVDKMIVTTLDGTTHSVDIAVNGKADPEVDLPKQSELLSAIASDFGDGVVNLGRDDALFDMDEFTISTTFELNSLDGGRQRVLWNHTQYGIEVNDDDLIVGLRTSDGQMEYVRIPDAFSAAGWHDVQVVYDENSTLNLYVDGAQVYSDMNVDVSLSGSSYWDVIAGGSPWGDELDGRVADVSIVGNSSEISQSDSIYERMYELDSEDLLHITQAKVEESFDDVTNYNLESSYVPPAADVGDVVTVSNAEELSAVLSSGVSGITIKLEAGDYVGIDISNINPDLEIVITSADLNNQARLSDLHIDGSSNLTFDAIDFVANSASEVGYFIVDVDDSSNISFKNSLFGMGTEDLRDSGKIGISVADSNNISISENEFTWLTRGAGFDNVDGLEVNKNYIHNLRSDGFNFVAVKNTNIINNEFYDMHPSEGDHPDYIQFWTTGAPTGSSNVLISGNFMAQSGGGDSQGIFIKDEDNVGHSNFIIENNIIYQSAYNGIAVSGIDGLVLRENTVVSTAELEEKLWIIVYDAENAVVERNLTNKLLLDENIPSLNNIIVSMDEENYSVWFRAPLNAATNEISDFQILQEFEAGANVDRLLSQGDSYVGDSADNELKGDEYNNLIKGYSGADSLFGGDGDDILYGGWGQDVLEGGSGDDVFVFFNAFDSAGGIGQRDKILDFELGDKISLQGLVDGDLSFIGNADFFLPSMTTTDEEEFLARAAIEFGEGVTSLGKDGALFELADFTISVTFDLNSLSGGKQALLYSHTQYAIYVVDDSLSFEFNGINGDVVKAQVPGVFNETGWQDIQLIHDTNSNEMSLYSGGKLVYSQTTPEGFETAPKAYWDVTAGGTPWGYALDGRVADVSFLDQVLEIDVNESIVQRSMSIDYLDDLFDLGLETGNAQVSFNEETNLLSIDLDGDLSTDMEIELVGVNLEDLGAADFLI